MMLVFAGVRELRDPQAKRLDIAGIVTLSVAVFGFVFFLTQGPDLGFASRPAIAILAVSALSLIAFVFVEKLIAHPMFDFSVLGIRNFSGALLGSMGMNFSFWPFMIYLPIFFQNGLGYDSVTAGLSLLAYTLPTLVFPPLGERLALRYRPGVVIPAGLFTIGLGFMLMKLGSGVSEPSWLTMLPGCLVAGIGLGITNTPVTNTTTGSVSSARAGMASGIDMSARMISLAINIALMGFILIEAIASRLKGAFGATLDAAQLRALAERLASGDDAQSVAQGFPGLASVDSSSARHSRGADARLRRRDALWRPRGLGARRPQPPGVRPESGGAWLARRRPVCRELAERGRRIADGRS